jgi:hypothetical protein
MKNPCYIQRGRFTNHKGPVTSIDQVIDYDVMSNAWFEFGALNRSLRCLADMVDELEVIAVDLKHPDGRGMFIICKIDDSSTVDGFIKKMATMSYHCQHWYMEEDPYLKNCLYGSGSSSYFNSFDVWWDLENNYLFGFGKKNMQKIIKGIRAYRDKLKRS